MTLATILSEIKRQLDWRGPNDKPQGHIVLHRNDAEYLYQAVLDVIIERDRLAYEEEKRNDNAEKD